MDPVKLRDMISENVLPVDDYVLVNPVAYSTLKTIKGFTDVTPDEIVVWNIYGYLDSGVEVRVFSMLLPHKMVVGSTPRVIPEPSLKGLPVLGEALPCAVPKLGMDRPEGTTEKTEKTFKTIWDVESELESHTI